MGNNPGDEHSRGGGGDYAPFAAAYEPADRRWRWLESTVCLQQEAYGRTQPDTVTGQAIALKENLLAALVELAGEVPREFHWKFWAHDEPWINREKLLAELVDVGHFLANMLCAVGVTDAEWEEAYQAKQAENRRRQSDGYTVQKGVE
jgi:dimeric dUTPase (all-alpha-NTP-PPase superfamily)